MRSFVLIIHTLKRHPLVITFLTGAIFSLLLFVHTFTKAADLLPVPLPPAEKITLFVTTLYDTQNVYTDTILAMTIVLSFLQALLTAVVLYHFKDRSLLMRRYSTLSGVALLVAILGTSCAACTLALASGIFSFTFLTSLAALLPFGGAELTFVGIITIAFLLYKTGDLVAKGNVC